MQDSAGFINEAEIAKGVAGVAQELAPEVVHIRYEIGTDWSGDPAIYFRILLSDEASKENRLYQIATLVRSRLQEALGLGTFCLLPYFNFRSVSEQAVLGEEAWA